MVTPRGRADKLLVRTERLAFCGHRNAAGCSKMGRDLLGEQMASSQKSAISKLPLSNSR